MGGRSSLGDPLGVEQGSKTPEEPQSSQDLARLATQLAAESAPLRQGLIGQSMDFMSGDFDVTGTPQFGALKQATEQQFDTARQRVLGSAPEGGALTQALTNVEMGRAGALTQGIGGLAGQQQAQALGLATGQTGQAISGLGGAAGVQSQMAQAQAAQNASTKQGMGQGAGKAAATIMASDRKLKDNLKELFTIGRFTVYSWTWNDLAKSLGISGPTIGVIAQDIQKIMPEAVSEHPDGYLMVDYGALDA